MASARRNKLVYAVPLLLSAPLIAGYAMNKLMLAGLPGTQLFPVFLYLPTSLTFAVFWAWVGSLFARLNVKPTAFSWVKVHGNICSHLYLDFLL